MTTTKERLQFIRRAIRDAIGSPSSPGIHECRAERRRDLGRGLELAVRDLDKLLRELDAAQIVGNLSPMPPSAVDDDIVSLGRCLASKSIAERMWDKDTSGAIRLSESQLEQALGQAWCCGVDYGAGATDPLPWAPEFDGDDDETRDYTATVGPAVQLGEVQP